MSSPKMLPVAVVLSVPAVEILLTVAGINMSMVRGGSGGGGGGASSRS